MSGLLEGEVALITGGASGLGFAIARRYLGEGARVALFDRSAERLASARRELGGGVVTAAGDVRSYADNVAAVAATREAFGKLSIFVGNAGIYDGKRTLRDIEGERLSEAFDEIYGIDVKGYMLGTKAALDDLIQTRGAVVFTCSISGMFPGYGGFLYTSAKHAVAGLTRHLAAELAPEVRVNAVSPGFVPTSLGGLDTFGDGRRAEPATAPDNNFLLQRMPTTEEYALPYVMLAARESASVLTGTVLLADGGGSIRRRS